MLDLDQLDALSKKVLGFSKSDWAEVSVQSGHSANLRFAANTVTTSGASSDTSYSITSVNGKRAGSVDSNDLSDDGIARAVAKAEEIASLAPENEELVPPLTEKQDYRFRLGGQ
jgi:predicted Zn-dependent protease